jgi:hypothetical protein
MKVKGHVIKFLLEDPSDKKEGHNLLNFTIPSSPAKPAKGYHGGHTIKHKNIFNMSLKII